VLVARLDSLGDVILAGPAVRALAEGADVDLLCSHIGLPAAALLPGVRRTLCFDAPWVLRDAPDVDRSAIDALVAAVAAGGYAAAAVLTSSHQSPLPLALLLRLAGVPEVAGVSLDHPGRLLDHRIPGDPDVHEVERGLLVAEALGARRPTDLALRLTVTGPSGPEPDLVAVHPGSLAPARTLPPATWREVVAALVGAGWDVVVTGSAAEIELCSFVAGGTGRGAAVRAGAGLGELARVLASAAVVVTGNTGPMHVAAAMGRPVVAAFAPTVPASRWAPWQVPHVLLGDQAVPCSGCRAVTCPLEHQWCLAGVTAPDVVAAVAALARPRLPTLEVTP
jgi:ADP-heptose:LPS heptosyltransferase